jgi:O-antigen/teichoic acid export membrane protein
VKFAAAGARWREIVERRAQANEFSAVLFDLVGDSAQYFIGLVLLGLANTILLPLYMRYLNPEQFGLYGLIEVTSLSLILIAGLGFNTSYLKWYAEQERGGARIFGSMAWTSAAAAGIVGAAFALFASSAAGGQAFGGEARRFAYLLLPLVVLEAVYACFETHLRAERRPAAISISALVRLIAIAAFSVWLMALRGRGLAGLFEGRVLGDACSLLAAGFFCRRDFTLRISSPAAKAMLRYGMPLVLIGLAMLGLDATGRYLLDHYGSLNEVGLYTAGIKISNLMRILFVAPLGAAWGGLMFQIAKNRNARFIYSKLFGYVFLLAGTVALVVALMTPGLFAVLASPAYRGGMSLIPWLLLVQVLSVMQAPLATGLYVSHATRWLIPIYVTGLGADFVAGRALVPSHGMFGAAWAWLIGWGAMCTLLLIAGQNNYPLAFEWKPIALGTALCGAVALIPRLGVMNLDTRSVALQAAGSAAAGAIAVAYIVWDVRRSRAGFSRNAGPSERIVRLAAHAD